MTTYFIVLKDIFDGTPYYAGTNVIFIVEILTEASFIFVEGMHPSSIVAKNIVSDVGGILKSISKGTGEGDII